MVRQKSNVRTKGSHVSRAQLAHEIARLMWEYQIEDFKLAKDKVLKHMNLRRVELPDNLEITQALHAYSNLFAPTAVTDRRQQLLETSGRLMAEIIQFEPRLVGLEADAVVTLISGLDVHVFCDQPEAFDIFLQERSYDYSLDDKRFRFGPDEYETRPCYQFDYEDIDVSVTVFPLGARSHIPLSPVDGKPIRRLSLHRIGQMMNTD